MLSPPNEAIPSRRSPSEKADKFLFLDEPQSLPPFPLPFFTPQPQPTYGFSSHTHNGASTFNYSSTGPTSSIHEPLTPFLKNTYPTPARDEQVPPSRIQRSGAAPPVPPYSPTTPLYTSNFFQNQGNLPVPYLRPASWGSPSQTDAELVPIHHSTGSRSSVYPRRDLFKIDEEEGTLFGGRTLPPLITPYDTSHLDVHLSSNAGHISSCERTSDSGNVSATSYVPNGSRLNNFSNDNNISISDQSEASTSARHIPSTPPPISLSDSYPGRPTPPTHQSYPNKPRQRAPRPKKQRDVLPNPRLVAIINCGWTGCDCYIQHEAQSIKDHIRVYHTVRDDENRGLSVTCRWVRRDTGRECGSRLMLSSIPRHTLSIHTNLILKRCGRCKKEFRIDTLQRHNCEHRGKKR